MRLVILRVGCGVGLLTLSLGLASPATAGPPDGLNLGVPPVWRVSFAPDAPPTAVVVRATFVTRASVEEQTPAPARPKAFEYSDAYRTRDRIHHIASFATLPLFAAEAVIGEKMFNNSDNISPSLKSWHGALADAIIGLFAANSVTGVWNWWEGRRDPNAGKRRTIHAILMLASDAGFVATALTSPEIHTPQGREVSDPKKRQHAWLASTSITTATVGYLIMVFR